MVLCMPRSFNIREEDDIRGRLQREAATLFARQGVLKTTIEQIVKSVGIAKGSFYKFYPSKEVLFFMLMEQRQNAIRGPLLNSGLPKTRDNFETLIFEMFKQVCQDPLIQYMGKKDQIMVISRRVPVEILMSHQEDDQRFLDDMVHQWNAKVDTPPRDKIAAHMSLLVLMSINQDFMSDRLMPFAAKSVITSLADCFFERPEGTGL